MWRPLVVVLSAGTATVLELIDGDVPSLANILVVWTFVGLGLAIARTMAQLHGGDLEYRADNGDGQHAFCLLLDPIDVDSPTLT